jgi:DNA repair exonuclease SbcCD nuclease subunit
LFPYLLEHNIKHIVHLGDYYDNRKFINFRALNRNRNHFLKPLREHGITMDIICGNHDTFYKNTSELNSLKELLGHYMNEITIIQEPTVMEYGSLKMGLVPWIDDENEQRSLDFLAKAKCDWIGGHFEICGYEMMKGIKNEHGYDRSIFKRFEKVMSGHFHTKSSQDNIEYLGSQMEFFWNDAHDKKYFHILDTETRELTPIRNPHTLFHRIVYDDSKHDYLHYPLDDIDGKFVKIVVINKSDTFTFDRLVDRIQNRNILELKIAENFNEFIGSAVDDQSVSVDDTPTLLNSYIDAVDTDLDKDRIKLEMSGLMIEAQTLEIA